MASQNLQIYDDDKYTISQDFPNGQRRISQEESGQSTHGTDHSNSRSICGRITKDDTEMIMSVATLRKEDPVGTVG